jgi:hypothetical protein
MEKSNYHDNSQNQENQYDLTHKKILNPLEISILIDINYQPIVSRKNYHDLKIIEIHRNKAGKQVIIVPLSFLPHSLYKQAIGMYNTSKEIVYMPNPEEIPLEYSSTLSHEEGHSTGMHHESGAVMYSRSEGHFNKNDFAKKSDFFYFLSA